uniref:RxLR effector protein n=1 Tax=Phytophthora agathidicida TaxID=1642459 RepID=A0A7G4WHZ1_9STRA|nr:PaRXLR2 [Phytophthora agathidicida]
MKRVLYIVLLATAIIFFASTTEAASTVKQTKLEKVASLNSVDAATIQGNSKRFLRTRKTDDTDVNGESYDADSEERGVKDTIAKQLGPERTKKLVTMWKTATNKDFRNMRLFLNEKTTFEELYKKKATPYKLSTAMAHNEVPKVGAIDERWGKYLKYWVNRNAGGKP